MSKSRAHVLDAERKRRKRAEEKDVRIPTLPAANRRRRNRLEKDTSLWVAWYFAHIYVDGLQEHHKEAAQMIVSAARHGGDQALAAPRGEGKTTICECVLIYCVLTGLLTFPVIFSATGPDAERILDTIRDHFESNDRLAADYPEVCVPIDALANAPSRARGMTVSGTVNGVRFSRARCRFRWCGREITLPNVPGSRCAGAIIATRGLDAAVKGLKVGSRRPDLAMIDDPDTDDTAGSEEQAAKLERRIERNIGGLGGQRRDIARVMLTTLMNRRCVSAKFTDPAQKPSWNGRRLRFLVALPERQDLWEEYISLRQSCQRDGDRFGRKAEDFYLANREEMDRGAVVLNPYRYSTGLAPDGRPLEVSALQHYYNFVARNGLEAALCELQNDPPEESSGQDRGITAYRVQTQVSGAPRKIVPAESIAVLTQGIDVGKYALHWVVTAWRADATGWVIDYGVQEVWGTTRGSDEAVDTGIKRAVLVRHEAVQQSPYTKADGEIVEVKTTLVDCHYREAAVFSACREIGFAARPALGFGQSGEAGKTTFHMPKPGADRRPGDHWYMARQPKGLWLICNDADHWKGWVHDRFMTTPGQPGSLQVFGSPSPRPDRLSEDQRGHFNYAKHITNEIEEEVFVPGKGLRRRFKVKSDTNHYLDATYMACVAASMHGVELACGDAQQRPRRRVSLAQVAQRRA